MTKNDEKRILEQIFNLINATGKDSYISAAFAGCYEIAKSNIENDFMNSMQESLLSCRKNLDAEKEARKNDLSTINHLSTKIAEKDKEIKLLKQQLKSEKNKQLPEELYQRLWVTVDEKHEAAMVQIERTAELLSYCADDPTDIAVANGLKRLRSEYQKRDDAARLLADLEKYGK